MWTPGTATLWGFSLSGWPPALSDRHTIGATIWQMSLISLWFLIWIGFSGWVASHVVFHLGWTATKMQKSINRGCKSWVLPIGMVRHRQDYILKLTKMSLLVSTFSSSKNQFLPRELVRIGYLEIIICIKQMLRIACYAFFFPCYISATKKGTEKCQWYCVFWYWKHEDQLLGSGGVQKCNPTIWVLLHNCQLSLWPLPI